MNKKLSILALALASSTSMAGAMGPISAEKLFILEGGVAYTHSFYKTSAVFPESYTPITPAGYAINPRDFYPEDFFGGYAGLSFYFPDWLVNARYNLFGAESKHNVAASTAVKLAPSKLSFTADRVFGDINTFSFGLGGGVVIENLNKGYAYINVSEFNPLSESLQGRSRIDPLVEAFLMYRFDNNFGVKFNAEYQIPSNTTFGRGDLNLNLGLNYAFPI